MKRVVVLNWKKRKNNTIEIFSNLKLLCASYPAFSYNTLNNYLSKNKIAFENPEVRIERMPVHTTAIPLRKIQMTANRIDRKDHDEEAQNRAYWLSRTPGERLDAVTMLRSQVLKKGQRMNKEFAMKRKVSK
jgi:hypothetical protein